MEENNEGKSLNIENISSAIDKVRRWVFGDLARNGVHYIFAFSLIIFALYMAGSIPDPGFSDRILFLLLRVLRYSSLISCAFSLFALGFCVRHLVYLPSFRNILRLLLYFAIGIFSASLSMLDTFIIAATEGNI